MNVVDELAQQCYDLGGPIALNEGEAVLNLDQAAALEQRGEVATVNPRHDVVFGCPDNQRGPREA
jgi:hypothetical protein